MLSSPTLFQREKYIDNRGFLIQVWNPAWPWKEIGGFLPVQENLSKSRLGTFRGMHWQLPPFEQGKLVTVPSGAITDYVVDIRKSSQNYGEVHKFEIDSDNMHSLWVPPGFAHGFESLVDDTLVIYQVTKKWSKDHERSFSPLSLVEIAKSVSGELVLSDKDAMATNFKDLRSDETFD